MTDRTSDKLVAVTILLVFVGGALCGAAIATAYAIHVVEHLECKRSITYANRD